MTKTANGIITPSPSMLLTFRVSIFLLCLYPVLSLAHAWINATLGVNPIEAVTHSTGQWTLRFLLITLAITPLRRLTGMHWLLRLRRMLGLFAFFYACLHLATYAWLDFYLNWNAIALDILDRPFITVGFAAFLLLVPLAATSNHAAVRRLGGKRWQHLHRSVYAIAILGVIHLWWQVETDYFEPFIYAVILAVLLGTRAWWRELERRRQLANVPGAPQFKGKVIRILPK